MMSLKKNAENYDLKLARFKEQLVGFTKAKDVLSGVGFDLGDLCFGVGVGLLYPFDNK